MKQLQFTNIAHRKDHTAKNGHYLFICEMTMSLTPTLNLSLQGLFLVIEVLYYFVLL